MIAYSSIYGHTKKAVDLLASKLTEKGCPKVVVHDLAREDMALCVSDAFRYGKLVLASVTYNADVFPFMKDFIHHLTERNFQNRTVALMENGSWAPMACKVMKAMLENCKNITWAENHVTVKSALNSESSEAIEKLSDELCRDYIAKSNDKANKHDMTALFKIGYGLYVVTSNDGKQDNGLIVNTVTQLTDNPNRVAVNINKQNYSHHVIKQTGKLNVNCLSVDAPFSIFERFGFQSGRTVNKFEGFEPLHSDNGLAFLPRYINAFMSLEVEDYVDLQTHMVCSFVKSLKPV